MSGTMLSQLVDAEALLAEQETALVQQLSEIKEQREGLQTVIAMFDDSTSSAQSVAVAVAVEMDSAELEDVEDEDDELEDIEDEDIKDEDDGIKETVAAKLAKVMKSKISARKSKKKSRALKKVDGRTARWQRYVLDAYRQQRLPDVVASVLKTKPKDSFKITAVMSAIFEADMPETQYLKARSRISNILSAGARNSEWYRGRGGTYSMSKKAVRSS